MKAESPLNHPSLREIEQSLRAGNTRAAARGLARFSDHQELSPAVDYLTIRLLYNQGRIDAQGATSRLQSLLSLGHSCSEAEGWLSELARAPEPSPAREPSARPSQPDLDAYDEDNIPTPVPPPSDASQALTIDYACPSPEVPHPRPVEALVSPLGPRRYRTFDKLDKVAFLPENAGRYGGGRTYRPKPRASADAGAYAGSGNLQRAESSAGTAGSQEHSLPLFDPGSDLGPLVAAAVVAAEAGRTEQACVLVAQLGNVAAKPPGWLAAEAKLRLALGQLAAAWELAEAALDRAGEDADVRLTYAWTAVRLARSHDDEAHLVAARTALGDCLAAPVPGLKDALSANLEARLGDPQVALRLAQSALRSNAHCQDGLAALAEAAGLLGQQSRAQTAYEQLLEMYPSAAGQLRPRLRRLGVLEEGPISAESFWPPIEAALLGGAHPTVRRALNEAAAGLLAQALDPAALEVFELRPLSAAEFLAQAPVFRHFGAFDRSSWSVGRLETALALIYGVSSQPIDFEESGPLATLCGLYLGQVLCKSYRLVMRGSIDEPRRIECVGGAGGCHPVEQVLNRLSHGRHAPLRATLDRTTAPSSCELGGPGQPALCPLPSWGQPSTADEAARLGRAMARSPVSLYCSQLRATQLDFTAGSLSALDAYLELVSPLQAPVDPGCPWGRWLQGTVGTYLGETLCRVHAGHWVSQDGQLQIERPDGSTTDPLEEVRSRLAARGLRAPLAACCE